MTTTLPDLRAACVAKLNPGKIRPTPKFSAILACLLGTADWAQPNIAALTVTSDGFLLARRSGDFGFNDFLGTYDELHDNVVGIARAAGLSVAETEYLVARCEALRRFA